MENGLPFDSLQEECGVFGIYSKSGDYDVARFINYGLIALQHRGQESAGIATYRNKKIVYYKEMGLVREVFNQDSIFKMLDGNIALGHVRYSTTGNSYAFNAQPLVTQYKGGSIALAHNGNLINALEIRDELEDSGATFQTTIDSEVIAKVIARNYPRMGYQKAIIEACKVIRGAFSLGIICEDKLIGVRDPHGLRPLCIGKFRDGYVLSSESCAFSVIGAEFIRDVHPGELVIIDDNGIESILYDDSQKRATCSFEYVYFCRPDSVVDGISVYQSRLAIGKILAEEDRAEGMEKPDVVMAVPDSGTVSAIGYAEECGAPFREGLLKNKYLGRTFIAPTQEERELLVSLKLSVLAENVRDKNVVLVDDSIVRGTTSKIILKMLRQAGAKSIHLRIASPPVKHSCHFGLDTSDEKELLGANHSPEEICQIIGADSLKFIQVPQLSKAIGKSDLCFACFNKEYPMEIPENLKKLVFEER
ncbi:MAG: amidophosphoribosyltransferase [Eubacteriales bacterium]